jgi:hypothetical protein
MIGWIFTGLICTPIAIGIIKGFREAKSPSNYEKNLEIVKRERLAREAGQRGKRPQHREQQAFNIVAKAAPRDPDLNEWSHFGKDYRLRPPITATIRYQSKEGEITTRTVDVTRINATKHKDGTITLVRLNGFCHLRNEDRSFYFRQIEVAADPQTGETIDHFGSFLARKAGWSGHIRRSCDPAS